MKVFINVPDGFYAVKDNEFYSVDLPLAKFPNTKHIKIEKLAISTKATGGQSGMTEEEKIQYSHDKNAFFGDILFALNEDLLSSSDMIAIMKTISRRMDEKCHTSITTFKVGVPVTVGADEIQHVGYDDAQLGREK